MMSTNSHISLRAARAMTSPKPTKNPLPMLPVIFDATRGYSHIQCGKRASREARTKIMPPQSKYKNRKALHRREVRGVFSGVSTTFCLSGKKLDVKNLLPLSEPSSTSQMYTVHR